MLVPVYTRFGYGTVDLAKYEKILEVAEDKNNSVVVKVNLTQGAFGYIQVSKTLSRNLSLTNNQLEIRDKTTHQHRCKDPIR